MTLATIAIPTYNRAQLLARAVDSALAQDYADVEVLIVDNASSDSTQELCTRLAADNVRVRYVRQPEPVPAIANFKAALAAARGTYFMWLADDDWLEPSYVADCIQRLEEGAVLATGRCRWFDGDGVVLEEEPVRLISVDPIERVRRFYGTVLKNSVFYGVVRTDAARTVVPHFDGTGGDWLFVAALALSGPIDTVSTTAINRSCGGGSDAITDAWRALPRAVARNILRTAPYDGLSWRARVQLAARCTAVTAWRLGFWFPLLAALRRWLPHTAYEGLWRSYRRIRTPGAANSGPIRGKSKSDPNLI